uniref:FBD domain-containing protein n=1 Tax=Setaria viridis TaxID=4556 RepID=A0A4U6TWH4_SETVI|nr:hypothetical protein SEVIR_7G253250v2 [Setaria viridis]
MVFQVIICMYHWVSASPTMEIPKDWSFFTVQSEELSVLDEKAAAFNYLTSILNFHIISCPSLVSVSLQTFSKLIYLERLQTNDCPRLISPRRMLHGSYTMITHKAYLHLLQDT